MFSLTYKASVISRVLIPAAMCARISNSRGVMPSSRTFASFTVRMAGRHRNLLDDDVRLAGSRNTRFLLLHRVDDGARLLVDPAGQGHQEKLDRVLGHYGIDPTVFRPSTGFWYSLRSGANDSSDLAVPWGFGTNVPIGKRT